MRTLQNSSSSLADDRTHADKATNAAQVVLVAAVGEFKDLQPIVVNVDPKTKVGVVRFKGKYYAYRNSCPHQGGPTVEGAILGNTECEVLPNGNRKRFVSKDHQNIVCPWHGVEFDLETGVCKADRRMRLRSFQVIVDGDLVKIRV